MGKMTSYRDATMLAAEIRRGERSPTSVIDSTLERIDERNDRTNAFVTVAHEQARERAKAVEAALKAGDDVGPLCGVPVAVKDLVRTANIRTTHGSAAFETNIPEENDRLVDRLIQAGAVIVGKTNTPEFGRKTVTDNPLFGATRNPWDTTRTSGGSSGGSAAAVADGLVPVAIGTDAAGSIRVPSSFCGTVGFVPDFGRIPHGPSQADAFRSIEPYTYAGPMTRSTRDAALLLDVMAGPAACDPYSLPKTEKSYRERLGESIDKFDIAYAPDAGGFPIEPAVTRELERTLETLKAGGTSITKIDFAFENLWEVLHQALEHILQTRYVGLYENCKRDSNVDLLETDHEITPEVVSRIESGLSLSVRDYKRAQRIRTRAYETVQSVFEEYDALIMPTTARPAFLLENDSPKVAGKRVDPMHGWMPTWPLNLTGNPVGAIPAGSVDGLPIGMQLIGPRGSDSDILALCDAVERLAPWDDKYSALKEY